MSTTPVTLQIDKELLYLTYDALRDARDNIDELIKSVQKDSSLEGKRAEAIIYLYVKEKEILNKLISTYVTLGVVDFN